MTTTTPAEAAPHADLDEAGSAGFWAHIPRGAELDARSFATRHRILLAVLALHLPGLAAFAWFRGVGGLMVWGQLAGSRSCCFSGSPCAARSPARAPSPSG